MSGFTPLQEDCFSPQQAMQLVARTGEKKASIRIDKFIFNSILAGALLGFGCAAALVVGASPWYNENAPGVESMLAGAVFPIGLILIALTGAELWTSTIMYTTVAFLEKRATVLSMAKTWSLSYIGNLGGILFFLFINCEAIDSFEPCRAGFALLGCSSSSVSEDSSSWCGQVSG